MCIKKKAAIDSSSLILLAKIGMLEYLVIKYSIIISQSVFCEVTNSNDKSAEVILGFVKEKLIHKEQILIEPGKINGNKLHSGERDTIALYIKKYCNFIITDDKNAAKYCITNKIPFINAILVIKALLWSGLLDKNTYSYVYSQLLSIARYSDFVLEYASTATSEQLQVFI